MWSRNSEPQGQAPDVNEGEEGGSSFGVACRDASPAFEVEEGILHQMAQFIEVLVVRALDFAMLARWDHRLEALRLGLRQDGVRIVAAIRDQIVCGKARDERESLCAISGGTFCNKHSERQTMRIHGQMNFGVEPPFVRLMA